MDTIIIITVIISVMNYYDTSIFNSKSRIIMYKYNVLTNLYNYQLNVEIKVKIV